MDRETLFLRTLDDLEARIRPGIDEYEVLLLQAFYESCFSTIPRLSIRSTMSRSFDFAS